jgi:glycosyltransferase involved in cell wall biosynthesis
MILVVAPYSSIHSRMPNLGAARKLETIVRILSAIDSDVVLVNTAHNSDSRSGIRDDVVSMSGIKVRQITPETYSSRTVGKLLNLFQINHILSIIRNIGRPALVWIYNGYAFEAIAARRVHFLFNCPVVLEFEDWHFSRGRGFSVKPFVDYVFWRRVVPVLSLALCVNRRLAQLMTQLGVPAVELPGLVSSEICDLQAERESCIMQRGSNSEIIVGYFGGLTAEKGCLELYEAIKRADGARFIVCGSGAELERFLELEQIIPGRLEVYSGVPVHQLVELVSRCDVMVNPHRVSEAVLDGLFPSKVLEAIGSGRIVVSTQLPELSAADVLAGVLYYDGSVEGLVSSLQSCRKYGVDAADIIAQGARRAVEEFGEESLKRRLSNFVACGSMRLEA